MVYRDSHALFTVLHRDSKALVIAAAVCRDSLHSLLCIYPLFRGVATPREDRPELYSLGLGLNFFVHVLLLSMLTDLFLSLLFLCLISFLLFPCASVWENTRA